MAFDSHAGANKLAQTLSNRMNNAAKQPLILDFGSINNDYSLKTNTFPVNIPKSDYTVCRHISGLGIGAGGGAHSGHTTGNGSHSHTVVIPKVMPGDRVLVAWIDSEVVVIDVIVPAARL